MKSIQLVFIVTTTHRRRCLYLAMSLWLLGSFLNLSHRFTPVDWDSLGECFISLRGVRFVVGYHDNYCMHYPFFFTFKTVNC